MDVDSIRAFKKARKHFKEQSLILKAKEENEKAREKRMHERRRTRVKFSIPEPADPKPEIKDSAKVMLELKKELNIPDDDDDDDVAEDNDSKRVKLPREGLIPKIEEIKRDNGEKEDSSQVNDNGVIASESRSTDIGRTAADEEGRVKKNETQSETQDEGCSSSSGRVDKNSNEGDVARVIEDNSSGSSANVNSTATGSIANVNSSATGSSANVNSSATGSSANVNSSATGSIANVNSSATDSSVNVNTVSTQLLSPAVTASHPQPYGKKLPFIPPNYTNLKALRSLLDDREKLFAKACQQFKVAELRSEFYEKPKSNATPYMRSLLSLVNPDKGEIRKRAKRKLDNDLEKNSFVDSIEKVKKSYEFTKLKARFLAMFTWPALISTVKPPKDNKLLQTEASASAQNESHKDSEKENMDGDSPVQTPFIDASDESSDDSGSEMDVEPEVSTTSSRKRTMQQLEPEDNQERDNTTPTKKCRKMKMIPLEYKDLEKMVETELTEKEEMEIMVMNIMCRTHG